MRATMDCMTILRNPPSKYEYDIFGIVRSKIINFIMLFQPFLNNLVGHLY